MGRYNHRDLVARVLFGAVEKPLQTRANNLFVLAYGPSKYKRPVLCLDSVEAPPLRRDSSPSSDTMPRVLGRQQVARPGPPSSPVPHHHLQESEQYDASTPRAFSPVSPTLLSPSLSSSSSELVGPKDNASTRRGVSPVSPTLLSPSLSSSSIELAGPEDNDPSSSDPEQPTDSCFTKDERGRFICNRCKSLFHRAYIVRRHYAHGTCTPGKPATAYFCPNPKCIMVFHRVWHRDRHVADGTRCSAWGRNRKTKRLNADSVNRLGTSPLMNV